MLNSTSLLELSMYFQKLVLLVKSKFVTDETANALSYLNKCLSDRNIKQIDEIEILNYETRSLTGEDIEKAKTIKDKSKFTSYFKNIENSVKLVDDKTGDLNPYYCSDIIKFLQEYYMPYCFLWSSLVLKGVEDDVKCEFTRMSNASLEQYFSTRKESDAFKELKPNEYLIKNFPLTRGELLKFQHKAKAKIDDEKIDDNPTLIDLSTEYNDIKAIAKWGKKGKVLGLLNGGKGYQGETKLKPINDLVKEKSEKSKN